MGISSSYGCSTTIQYLANVPLSSKDDPSTWSRCVTPLHPHERPIWSFWFLAVAWSSPGHCILLENEPKPLDGRSSHSVFPSVCHYTFQRKKRRNRGREGGREGGRQAGKQAGRKFLCHKGPQKESGHTYPHPGFKSQAPEIWENTLLLFQATQLSP